MGIKTQDMVVELKIRYNMWLGDEDSKSGSISTTCIIPTTYNPTKNLSSQPVHKLTGR